MVSGTTQAPVFTTRTSKVPFRSAGGRYAAATPVEVYRDGKFVRLCKSEREASRYIAAQSRQEVR